MTNGERVSNGTVFVFAVMRRRSSVSCATLPVISLFAEIDQQQVVVGAARDQSEAALRVKPAARARAFATICRW